MIPPRSNHGHAVNGLELLAYMGHSQGPCPYLEGQDSSLLFVDGDLTGEFYRDLLDKGYRRIGRRMYRPDCGTCAECKVIRAPVETFRRTKEQRRIWNRGRKAFTVEIARPSYSAEKAALYRRYLRWQHDTVEGAGDPCEYEGFFVETCLGNRTLELQHYYEGALTGVGIVDIAGDALSSMYFFFEPDTARFSPGTYSALYEIELAREWGLRYYYIGYYIAGCSSMNYKTRFRPCEVKGPDDRAWVVYEESRTQAC